MWRQGSSSSVVIVTDRDRDRRCSSAISDNDGLGYDSPTIFSAQPPPFWSWMFFCAPAGTDAVLGVVNSSWFSSKLA